MMFPFSINSEAIEIGVEVVNMTPTNGKMFLCQSHFHPITSLTRCYGYGLSNHFGVLESRPLTLCSLARSARVATLRILSIIARSLKVALNTVE